MQIEPNKIIGISGKSGSGKSTLLKLFMRFWDIKKGNLKISGSNIKDINTDSLRDIESYVTQETSIFKDTIENNIKIADKNATREEVIEACKKASLHDFIMSLPNGYDTVIGENGELLSGGQRQRISIARALLKDANVILLDEATSFLDVENESKIQKALSELIKNKTVIIIAHRMRTIANADRIVVLDDGKIVEQGMPEELIADNGLFKKMVDLQNLSGEWQI